VNFRITSAHNKAEDGAMDTLKKTVALAAISALSYTAAAADDANVTEHMHKHHDAMIAIQQAIIAGSFADTRESAQWLLDHEQPAGLPAAGSEFVVAMREAADGVLNAENLEAAAEATSQMGHACGNCHLATQVMVEFDEADNPSDEIKDKPHMQRHQWAADRMWEGLIGPSDQAWSRGANLLFESPIKPNVLNAHGGGEEVIGMSRRIHQLAGNATVVSNPEEKVEIYAEFIANCGSCHAELSMGPR